MTTLNLSDPTNGTTADANLIATNNALIETVVNGGLDAANVATGTFLQLLTGGTARKVAFGSSSMSWGGGTPIATPISVAHGLGTTPLVVLAVSGLASGGFVVATYTTPGATNNTFGGFAQNGSPGGGATATVYWLAIA